MQLSNSLKSMRKSSQSGKRIKNQSRIELSAHSRKTVYFSARAQIDKVLEMATLVVDHFDTLATAPETGLV